MKFVLSLTAQWSANLVKTNTTMIQILVIALNVTIAARSAQIYTRVVHVKMDGGDPRVCIRATHAMIALSKNVRTVVNLKKMNFRGRVKMKTVNAPTNAHVDFLVQRKAMYLQVRMLLILSKCHLNCSLLTILGVLFPLPFHLVVLIYLLKMKHTMNLNYFSLTNTYEIILLKLNYHQLRQVQLIKAQSSI